MRFTIGVDIGGTCTDCIVVDGSGGAVFDKTFSTPPDFSRGIIDGIALLAARMGLTERDLLADTGLFLHSTTVGENAVTDGNLDRVGLLTTSGFEDTLFTMRGGYGRWSGLTEDEKRNPVFSDKPPPLVPRRLVAGIAERTDSHGERLLEIAPKDVESAARSLLERGASSFAVCFLWSFVNPENERIAGEVIRKLFPKKFLSLSHAIAPSLGEYERTSTVVLNSALGPVVRDYLHNLERALRQFGFDGHFLVAQGYGGLLPLDLAVERPVGVIESGPVAGVVGARAVGEQMGFDNIIAADMGGTTFKVGIVREGSIEYQPESMVYRYHFGLPKMDVTSLGLAGGSIIAIDPRTGVPEVGPNSAGSYPGPICYDHGGEEPTVTDVDAILGYLNADYFLGGREALNFEKSALIFREKVARPLGMSLEEAAAAVYRLTNDLIYDLLHKVTVERGLDPRDYTLFSFGGTAGMHVASYAQELGLVRIVIPPSASVHSAFGLVTSDLVHEYQLSRLSAVPLDPDEVNDIFSGLILEATGQLESEGYAGSDVLIHRSIDMRYRRQVHLLNVPIKGDDPLTRHALEEIVKSFESLYARRYGREAGFREAGIESAVFRIRATGFVKKPAFQTVDLSGNDPSDAFVRRARVYVSVADEMRDVHGYDFTRLKPGNEVAGPAVIWTPTTTIIVNSDQIARVDAYKNVIISLD